MLPCVPGLENETVLGTLSDISNRLYIVVFLSLLNYFRPKSERCTHEYMTLTSLV